MFCSRIFLLLTLLMKHNTQNRCLIYGTQVLILGKTETLCGYATDSGSIYHY